MNRARRRALRRSRDPVVRHFVGIADAADDLAHRVECTAKRWRNQANAIKAGREAREAREAMTEESPTEGHDANDAPWPQP